MALFKVKHRISGELLFETECTSLKLAIEIAVKDKRNLSWSHLRGAKLRDAELDGAKFDDADLHGSDFRGASLEGASLARVNLRRSNLRGADLASANLRNSDLRRANMRGVDLCRTDLRGAVMRGADLDGADLADTNLCGTDVRRVDLRRADLEDANLAGIIVDWSNRWLIAELLWRHSGENAAREQLAAWIIRKTDWCWPEWLASGHSELEWLLSTLATFVTPGDNAPTALRERVANLPRG